MNKRYGNTSVKILIGGVLVLAGVVAVVAVLKFDFSGRSGSGLGKEFSYDISELAKIDPAMMLYTESGSPTNTGLSQARTICIGGDGTIYVGGDKVIRIYDQNRSMTGEIAVAGSPQCMAVAEDGRIYVGMRDHVQVYEKGGRQLGAWENLGKDAVLTSVAVYKDKVFVADAGNRIVLKYSLSGELLGKIGERNVAEDVLGFVIPSPYFDLAVADDGLLRVVNPGMHRIEAYTFDGDLEFWWGKFGSKLDGFTGCCNPVNLAILPDGSFVTAEKGLVRVKIYDSDGVLVGAVAGPEQLVEGGVCRICTLPEECQSGGFDVAVDSQGRVYVLDTVKNVIRIFLKKEGA